MALRRQVIEVTTSLPTSGATFTGEAEESLIRYSNRPAKLVAFELEDDELTGQYRGFCVREVNLIDSAGDGAEDDEVPGRVIFNYSTHELATNDPNHDHGPVPISTQPHDVDGTTTTAALGGPVLFNTKKVQVEVFGGGAATDTISVVLYYESAGDYRF